VVDNYELEHLIKPYNASILNTVSTFNQQGVSNPDQVDVLLHALTEYRKQHLTHIVDENRLLVVKINKELNNEDDQKNILKSVISPAAYKLIYNRSKKKDASNSDTSDSDDGQCSDNSALMLEQDETNVFNADRHKQRAVKRVQAIWLYESLMRSFKISFKQPIP